MQSQKLRLKGGFTLLCGSKKLEVHNTPYPLKGCLGAQFTTYIHNIHEPHQVASSMHMLGHVIVDLANVVNISKIIEIVVIVAVNVCVCK